jgi:hypothetical protein
VGAGGREGTLEARIKGQESIRDDRRFSGIPGIVAVGLPDTAEMTPDPLWPLGCYLAGTGVEWVLWRLKQLATRATDSGAFASSDGAKLFCFSLPHTSCCTQ